MTLRRVRHAAVAAAILAIMVSGCSGHFDRAIERSKAEQAEQAAEETAEPSGQGASAEAPSEDANGTADSAEAGSDADEDSTSQTAKPDQPTAALDPDRPEIQKPPAPPQLHDDGIGAAIAVAKYFLQLYPYVYATGGGEEFEALSMPGCDFCEKTLKEAVAIKDAGGEVAGGLFDLEMIGAGGPYKDNTYMVEFAATLHSITEYRDGEPYRKFPTTEYPSLRVALSFDGEKWQVIGTIFYEEGEAQEEGTSKN